MIDNDRDKHQLALDFGNVRVEYSKDLVDYPDLEYDGITEFHITTDPKKLVPGDSPVSLRIFSDAGIVALQFTKQQAMMLADFLQLAKHVKEE